MKSEKEITDRLENCIAFMEQLSKDYSEIPPEQIPQNKKDAGNAAVMGILLLGWVLDCEEQLKPFIRAFKLAAVMEKMSGKI